MKVNFFALIQKATFLTPDNNSCGIFPYTTNTHQGTTAPRVTGSDGLEYENILLISSIIHADFVRKLCRQARAICFTELLLKEQTSHTHPPNPFISKQTLLNPAIICNIFTDY